MNYCYVFEKKGKKRKQKKQQKTTKKKKEKEGGELRNSFKGRIMVLGIIGAWLMLSKAFRGFNVYIVLLIWCIEHVGFSSLRRGKALYKYRAQ